MFFEKSETQKLKFWGTNLIFHKKINIPSLLSTDNNFYNFYLFYFFDTNESNFIIGCKVTNKCQGGETACQNWKVTKNKTEKIKSIRTPTQVLDTL